MVIYAIVNYFISVALAIKQDNETIEVIDQVNDDLFVGTDTEHVEGIIKSAHVNRHYPFYPIGILMGLSDRHAH